MKTAMKALIVFSHLRWEFVYQRPQQLMSRLAGQEFFVLFVEEPVWSDGHAVAGVHLERAEPARAGAPHAVASAWLSR